MTIPERRYSPDNAGNLTVLPAERIPEEVISGVVSFYDAKSMLDKNHQYLATEDFMRQNCWFSSPRHPSRFPTFPSMSKDGSYEPDVLHSQGMLHFSPSHFGRVIALWKENIPFNGFMGNMVNQKGGNVTGYYYDHHDFPAVSVFPAGFFGNRDAKRDADVSFILLAGKYRCALPLGYAVLDYDRLRHWIKDVWDIDDDYSILKNLSFVKKNGDEPVIYFRIGGIRNRLRHESDNPVLTESEFHYAMREGAQLLYDELVYYGSNSIYFKDLDSHFKEKQLANAKLALSILSRGLLPEAKQYEAFVNLLASIYAKNTIVMSDITAKNYWVDPNNTNDRLVRPKDICFGFFDQDYEDWVGFDPTNNAESLDQDSIDGITKIYLALAGNSIENFVLNRLNPQSNIHFHSLLMKRYNYLQQKPNLSSKKLGLTMPR